jgi:phage portal protein BeeE
MSPLQAALKVMTATNEGYDTMAKQFTNGGPDVIITGTKETATQEWNEEQFKTVWERFRAKFRKGSKERFMLKNLPVEVHEIGKSIVDLNVLEYMKLSLRDYCNIYNVPSALMNDNEFATQSANNREFQRMLWNNGVIPELERAKDSLEKIAANYRAATGIMHFIDYDISDIPELQADNSLMSQSLSTAWWLTPNQRLIMMGQAPDELDPMMNMRFVPMGLVPMGDLMDSPTDEETANKALHGLKY